MSEPDPRLKSAADKVGVTLLPWQVEVGNRALTGETFYHSGGRQAGWTTMRKVLRVMASEQARSSKETE